MQLGVYTFGVVLRDPRTGTTISPEQRLGAAPHRAVRRPIELLGTEVAPIVRAEPASRSTASA